MARQAAPGKATRRDAIQRALRLGGYVAPVVVAGVVPLRVGAVTGPTGVTLLVNGANTATLTIASVYTFSGRGYQPGATVYRVVQVNVPGGGGEFSYKPLQVAPDGTISDSDYVGSISAIRRNGPGSYTVLIASTITTTATDTAYSGVLVSLTITIVPL